MFFANLSAFSVFSLTLIRDYRALITVLAGELLDLCKQDGISIVGLFLLFLSIRITFRKCFELIINTWKRDKVTICEAGGLLHWLQDSSFFNLPELFPSVDATGRYSICSTAKAPGLFYFHSDMLTKLC